MSTPASEPAAVPRRTIHSVGPFVLGKTLGEGTTGKVKVAFHKETGFKVAVKIIRKDLLMSKPAVRVKVQREVVVMKLLNHHNVMKLYDVYETSKNLFLIMELVEGGELFDYIVKRRTISRSETRRIFREIIAGVDYMHEHGVAHRDLKPENIMLDHQKHVKIVDMGMSAVMRDGELLATSCGSPHYASPQVVSGEKYDGREADIWSCGVILFALMTSNLPFDDDNIRVLLQKVRRGVFKMPSFLADDVRDLISRMIVVDPHKRITMAGIKAHPWFTGANSPEGPLPPVPDSSMQLDTRPLSPNELDPDVMLTLECLRIGTRQDLERELTAAKPSQARTYYNILLDQKLHPPSDVYSKPVLPVLEDLALSGDVPENSSSSSSSISGGSGNSRAPGAFRPPSPSRTRAMSVSTPRPTVDLSPASSAHNVAPMLVTVTAPGATTTAAAGAHATPPESPTKAVTPVPSSVPHIPYAPSRPSPLAPAGCRARSASNDPNRALDKHQLALRLQQQRLCQQPSPLSASASPGAPPASAGTSALAASTPAVPAPILIPPAVPGPAALSPSASPTSPRQQAAPTVGRMRGNSVIVRRPVPPPSPSPSVGGSSAALHSTSHSRHGSISEESGSVPKRTFFSSLFRSFRPQAERSDAAVVGTAAAAAAAAASSMPSPQMREFEASNFEIRIRRSEVVVRQVLKEFFLQANIGDQVSPIGFRCTYVAPNDYSIICNFVVWIEDETIAGGPPRQYVQFLLSHGNCALFNQVCRLALKFFEQAS